MTINIMREDSVREQKSPKDNPEKDSDPAEQLPDTEKDPHRHC
jgi:hypothetical protein